MKHNIYENVKIPVAFLTAFIVFGIAALLCIILLGSKL